MIQYLKKITNEYGEMLTSFEFKPATLKDEYRAGGRLLLIIGRSLTTKARKVLGMLEADFFTNIKNPTPIHGQGYTLAQKIVGKACGVEGILPGSACEPKMTTVGSQDTTGTMTADELKEFACMEFQSEIFFQSFCHTAAYPKPSDVKMHKFLSGFTVERKGVALRPGDGVIHSWLNRLLVPDTMGTAGDSHTRFPIGLSFPAGSGLVAFAGTLGFMPLDMPESVLVKFSGEMKPGITLRDVVNAIPYFAIKKGMLTVEKEGKKNIFNGRIVEMEGLPDLTVEQAFELTDATAERSAPRMVKEGRAIYADPCSMIRAAAMLINHIGYPEKARKLEMALDICGNFEKKVVITGRSTGVTGAEYSNYLMETIQDPDLKEKWENYSKQG